MISNDDDSRSAQIGSSQLFSLPPPYELESTLEYQTIMADDEAQAPEIQINVKGMVNCLEHGSPLTLNCNRSL